MEQQFSNFDILKLDLNKTQWGVFFEYVQKNGILQRLDNFLSEEKNTKTIWPDSSKIFNAMELTNFENIKIIILGQDPYHTPNVAMGLAFGHDQGNKKIQPSLKNIYKEMKSCGYSVNEKSGDLTKWATQGVLLLNTALTVVEKKPGSHSKEWKEFTKAIIKFLSDHVPNMVVVLWGNHAQKYEPLFDAKKHKIIKSAHPSPLSATKGFFGSDPFTKCNEQLKIWNMTEIDWNL